MNLASGGEIKARSLLTPAIRLHFLFASPVVTSLRVLIGRDTLTSEQSVKKRSLQTEKEGNSAFYFSSRSLSSLINKEVMFQ